MPQDHNQELLSQLKYDGPKKTAAAWQAFARSYIEEHGEKGLDGLNALNELAFNISAKARQDAKRKIEPREYYTHTYLADFILHHSEANQYNSIYKNLNQTAAAISKAGLGEALNKAVVKGLVNVWLDLEKHNNIKPLRKSHTRKTPEWEAHHELFKSRDGGLIAHTLYGSVDGVLKAQSRIFMDNGYAKGKEFIDIYQVAYKTYESSLYRYSKGYGKGFLSYLTGRLKSVLKTDFSREIEAEAKTKQLKDGFDVVEPNNDAHFYSSGKFTSSVLTRQINNEYRELLARGLQVLHDSPDPDDQQSYQLLQLRFEIGSEQEIKKLRALQSIGAELDLTREAVRLRQNKAIARLSDIIQQITHGIEPKKYARTHQEPVADVPVPIPEPEPESVKQVSKLKPARKPKPEPKSATHFTEPAARAFGDLLTRYLNKSSRIDCASALKVTPLALEWYETQTKPRLMTEAHFKKAVDFFKSTIPDEFDEQRFGFLHADMKSAMHADRMNR